MKKEDKILELLKEGRSTKEIQQILIVSRATICRIRKKHNIQRKLNTNKQNIQSLVEDYISGIKVEEHYTVTRKRLEGPKDGKAKA